MTTDDTPGDGPKPAEKVTLFGSWAAWRSLPREAGGWLGCVIILAVLDALPWVVLLLIGWGVWWAVCKLWGLVFG